MAKPRRSLGRSDGMVEVEPIDEEGNPHPGRQAKKAPGPWPRGTRETAVFGGDCLSRLPFLGTECKPNIPFLMMADVVSVNGKVLPDSGRSDGPMSLSGPAQTMASQVAALYKEAPDA